MCFEQHHLGGQEFDRRTVIIVCVRCHRRLTDMQKDHPMRDPNADPFLQTLVHLALGLADLLELVVEKLREVAAALRIRARELGPVTKVAP